MQDQTVEIKLIKESAHAKRAKKDNHKEMIKSQGENKVHEQIQKSHNVNQFQCENNHKKTKKKDLINTECEDSVGVENNDKSDNQE